MSGGEFREMFDKAIRETVTSIQPGRVMSYGQVARAAGYPRHSRMVSKAMGRSAKPRPWYRVKKSDSTLAFTVGGEAYNKQRALLENEGVRFIGKKAVPVESDDSTELDELLWGSTE